MIRLHHRDARGRFRNHWLDARFSFSFGAWRDPEHDGCSDLRVFNEDRVAPGGGFTEHPHADVEVMSYPVAGTIEHRDSLGHVALMRPGDVHLMRAGTGIRHSEMNASATEPEHHLQWWIRPATTGLAPGYQRMHLTPRALAAGLCLIASPTGEAGSLQLAQDLRIHATRLVSRRLHHRPAPGRWLWLYVVQGACTLNGQGLQAGDAALVVAEPALVLAAADAELLLFDLRPDVQRSAM